MDKDEIHKLKFYLNLNELTLNPKIIFSYKNNNNNIFLDWFKFLDYFNRLSQKLDFYIVKCLIKDYYDKDFEISSRQLITKIVYNLNIFLYDMIHIQYFNTFDNVINRFKVLKEVINNSYRYNLEKLKKECFVNFLVSFLEIFEELIEIFDFNLLFFNNNIDNLLFYYEAPIEIEFIPFAGGKLEDKFINSFYVSKNLVTIHQYLVFINAGGYSNKKYWSEDGYYWLKYMNVTCPRNWYLIENEWMVNYVPISNVYNSPISKISYYEAEACAKFYNCEIYNEDERDWVYTNRNKTNFPTGIRLPILYDLNIDVNDIYSTRIENYKSLMNVNQLFGNTWEYTSSIKFENKKIHVCVKGGDYKIPQFILNKDLKMFLDCSNRSYNISFRLLKKNL